MGKSKKNKRVEQPVKEFPLKRVVREGGLFVVLLVAAFLFLSLLTFNPDDPAWSHTRRADSVANSGGVVGAYIADFMAFWVGHFALLVPIVLFAWLWRVAIKRAPIQFRGAHVLVRGTGLLVTIAAGAAIAAARLEPLGAHLPSGSGGIVGRVVVAGAQTLLGYAGGNLAILVGFLIGLTMLTGVSWLNLSERIGVALMRVSAVVGSKFNQWQMSKEGKHARDTRELKREKQARKPKPQVRIDPVVKAPETSVRAEMDKQIVLFDGAEGQHLPQLSLLDPPKPKENGLSPEALEALSRMVEFKLQEFGVEVTVVSVISGPVVTLFEMETAPGVKVSKISGLAKDLARAMSAESIRVLETIPGKPYVGLELSNEHRQLVQLSEILSSPEFDRFNSKLALGLGVDTEGKPAIVDLEKMPHMLVAGTTGSGKSVGINAMVLSMLFKSTPDDVRLIMIDPKMLELSVYENIPHLLTPVVTDMNDAVNALKWCVAEMDNRYRLMNTQGVRQLSGYNKFVKKAIDQGDPIPHPFTLPDSSDDEGGEVEIETLKPLPRIVVIIDELADMFMMMRKQSKQLEELIARLAQKARAAGIHLILATQRPSVDVLTGLIKANIPTRLAFRVRASQDSRTILDQGGAEHLLGNGDMLYIGPTTSVPKRIHGAFVSDAEVHRVAKDLRSRGKPEYVDEILDGPTESESLTGLFEDQEGDTEGLDELYDKAVALVTRSRNASTSSVQRHLRIGYNRAARIIDEMERQGVISPASHNGKREVLAGAPPDS